MLVLLDTNVFARSASPQHPHHAEVVAALRRLKRDKRRVCYSPQSAYEMWSVFTRPQAVNGFGWSSEEAANQLRHLTRFMRRLVDGPPVYREWLRLVRTHSVQGKAAHDARLVAIMNVHQVAHIVTFNQTDFTRYPGLTVWAPSEVS